MKKKLTAILCLGCLLIFSCKKEPEEVVPTVETYIVSNVGVTSANCGGKVISDGTGKVNTRGICWSKKNPPKISDYKKYDFELGDSSFICTMDDLELATTYYVMAFAINNTGFGYGEVKTFQTPGGAPTAETLPATNLGLNSARLNGRVTANYYYSSMLFEWGLTNSYGNVTEALPFSRTGFTPLPGKTYIYGLTKGTLYHYRTKAINPFGTTYGSDASFTTNETGASPIIFNPALSYGSVSDIDGNTYKTILIGTQTWMAENLRTTKFNNGTKISIMENYYDAIPQYGWYNNDIQTFKDIYGALYNWYTVDPAIRTLKNICPVGWHVPGDTEWNLLANFLGGNNSAGTKLKETTTTHWLSQNTGATNETGFTALPGGYIKDGDEDFLYYGSMSFWWSSSINTGVNLPYYWSVSADSPEINKSIENKVSGLSVRCVKDN